MLTADVMHDYSTIIYIDGDIVFVFKGEEIGFINKLERENNF
jgi:lipopolysaccharide biosynthesis glycosyltransferase